MFFDVIRIALIVLAIGLAAVILPALLEYIVAQITLRKFPEFAIRRWAMSGMWLKQLPPSCPFRPYGCADCKNWTCPEYNNLHKPKDHQTYI